MNIRHLRIFITVVDTGSMTKAAEELFIAQPSVSQTIKEIEEYYNIKLFERLSKKLYITEKGKEFLSYARHIVTLFDEMEKSIRQTDKNSLLRIGASITVGTYVLGKLTRQFLDDYPNIDIESVIDNTTIIEEMVLKNELDFGIVEGPIHSKDIVSKAFMDDELILICGDKHPFREKPYITLKELSKANFILRESGSGTRELFENIMLSKGLDLTIKCVSNSSEAIKNAVISNLGVSVISKMAVDSELKSKKLFHIKIDNIELKRKFNIIYHKNKYISKEIEEFWDYCFNFKFDR
ncbi:LysR family transcriptional regulator [Anaerosalibacter sp. Marseille-P3206]|uniref:LysR family transcriptional regulator n=1 Tax=Anaerosalibacter sp. Marseille-P3206 TaxID=1871005 RepID=UPI00098762A2|nr:LysR family transcriptional regulator [Anaerosalibacter sp. Marseille-P3206]